MADLDCPRVERIEQRCEYDADTEFPCCELVTHRVTWTDGQSWLYLCGRHLIAVMMDPDEWPGMASK